MALKVVISHKTRYQYDRKVSLSPHIFRLRPAPHSRTPIEAYSMKIGPEDHFFNWQQDPFGNYLARLVFNEKTDFLDIEVEIIADMKTINPFDFFIDEASEKFPFDYGEALEKELLPYLEIKKEGKLIDKWVNEMKPMVESEMKTIDFLVALNQKLHEALKYNVRMEPGVQTCQETLEKKSGSCRDFAWLLVQISRRLGLGARFVSGYLVQLTADVKSLDGPSGPENDFTDLHAWTEVYVPGAGWIGLDATSGLLTGEGHIPLACTPSPESAAPVTGMSDKCETEFFFSNDVKRIFESPRVTKPYKEEQWQAIYDLGFKVDEELEQGDVRLSMGGEPTFVSIDDMESAEWNTEADGAHKRELAENLSRRLINAFGKGGFLHHAQGKWYPGEPLPRWQVSLYWRKDGQPIWQNPELLADHNQDYGYGHAESEQFLRTLTKYLEIAEQNILPAYEDVYYYLWEEGNLPIDIDPLDHDFKDAQARRTLAENLERGLDVPKGFVLPLGWGLTKWITCAWEFRRKYLFLTPGNSPVGFRLPLKSLMFKPHVEIARQFEPDLFAAYPNLDSYQEKVRARAAGHTGETTDKNSYSEYVRTAISTEAREGKIYIFLPPLEITESYMDLLASIEMTAQELKVPVMIEGYAPPEDNRLEKLKITPDPGVIEVNIHPARNWKELSDNTLMLYEEARLSRLGTEKFLIDGRHTGTGGGNHVTVGGMTPPDSPLLRNPHLLRSLITFWQHHPGLSYLFSGAFIGPTSQAPRVDEGRLENLYELEIAFSQMPEGQVPYWLTDRLLRHMLTDITGNTHRAEFCIDKLYSPDSQAGRLGLLELRAFDMPPHAQMSLMQMLLVRTLIAWFWRKPYAHDLVRWGTELHDKFLLEHYVKEDIADIVKQLNAEGYPFSLDWFDPFFEFRFPLYGLVQIEGMELELRMAIEPWHVLGEEVTGQGTSRYVDSSVERVQIKIRNYVDERYILTCNGVRVPLSPTGVKGEYVSGVRYKAWQPWSALHPTVGIDAPLVFDIVDTWNKRSVGGCTYFVSHPGGRFYGTNPVNSYEAESRRINRFWNQGHTQGVIVPINQYNPPRNRVRARLESAVSVEKHSALPEFHYDELPPNQEFPHTLDMRKKWKRN